MRGLQHVMQTTPSEAAGTITAWSIDSQARLWNQLPKVTGSKGRSAKSERENAMPKSPRIVLPEIPHHITQRGNKKAAVFTTDDDRGHYLDLIRMYLDKFGLRLHAYCLMSNHVHLVMTPKDTGSISNAMRDIHRRYARHLHGKTEQIGHLWQARFFSCPMDEAHFQTAVRYVERNPVRAGMTRRAEEFRWSSAPAHCRIREDPLLSGDLPSRWGINDWSDWLAEGDGDPRVPDLRADTITGRPLGSADFLRKVEKRLGQRLKPRRRKVSGS